MIWTNLIIAVVELLLVKVTPYLKRKTEVDMHC